MQDNQTGPSETGVPQGERPVAGFGLLVGAYAAIIRSEAGTEYYGQARALDALPAQKVRRLSELERGVIACVIDLPETLADAPYVLASRYGAMPHTLKILKDLAAGEALSPTAFALSVHNAVLGAASQLAGNKGGHTALSAGEDSLMAGFIECAARLSTGDEEVVLIVSDLRLQEEYAAFETVDADVQLACTLRRRNTPAVAPQADLPVPGPEAASQFLRLLASDTKELKWPI